jgi:hypothetical protein
MCKLSIQTLSTYVVGAMLLIQVHETCPNPLHMVKCLGKQHEFKFEFISYLCEGCHQLPKRRILKALVWFWLIDKTYLY